MDKDGKPFQRVRSRGLKAAQRIGKGEWVQQYGGTVMAHKTAQELEKKHPERAYRLKAVGPLALKINGCPADLRAMAANDCLAPLANHAPSAQATCELVVRWVCSPDTGIAPSLFLRALRDLEIDDDITWDYGPSAHMHHQIGNGCPGRREEETEQEVQERAAGGSGGSNGGSATTQ
jgi:hypothetical protein